MKPMERMSRGACLGIVALLSTALGALAGPNAGGVLVVHDIGLKASGTIGSNPICAQGNVPTGLSGIDARIDGAVDGTDPAIFRVYAVFPEGSSPRLMGITFGIRYEPQKLLLDPSFGKCGDFELNDTGWPAPDKGCSVTWNAPATAVVTPVYWFAAYQYSQAQEPLQPSTFDLIPHPAQGGAFGDDYFPAHLDAIGGYGKIGFDMEGEVPPPGGRPGACCDLATDECSFKTAAECGDQNSFKGPDVLCIPDPCIVLGGCCYPDNICQNNISRRACEEAGGRFLLSGCTSGSCSFYPQGSCCRNGGATCSVTIAADCADGMWREGMDCNPEQPACEPQMGACCMPTECFVILTGDNCPGIFRIGEDCLPLGQICPVVGSCCTDNPCTLTLAADCAQPGAVWVASAPCTPNNPCPRPVVLQSWGKLKSLYWTPKPGGGR